MEPKIVLFSLAFCIYIGGARADYSRYIFTSQDKDGDGFINAQELKVDFRIITETS